MFVSIVSLSEHLSIRVHDGFPFVNKGRQEMKA